MRDVRFTLAAIDALAARLDGEARALVVLHEHAVLVQIVAAVFLQTRRLLGRLASFLRRISRAVPWLRRPR